MAVHRHHHDSRLRRRAHIVKVNDGAEYRWQTNHAAEAHQLGACLDRTGPRIPVLRQPRDRVTRKETRSNPRPVGHTESRDTAK